MEELHKFMDECMMGELSITIQNWRILSRFFFWEFENNGILRMKPRVDCNFMKWPKYFCLSCEYLLSHRRFV